LSSFFYEILFNKNQYSTYYIELYSVINCIFRIDFLFNINLKFSFILFKNDLFYIL